MSAARTCRFAAADFFVQVEVGFFMGVSTVLFYIFCLQFSRLSGPLRARKAWESDVSNEAATSPFASLSSPPRKMSLAIKTFPFPERSLPAGPSTPSVPLTSPLTLALARKGASYLLVHPTPLSTSSPNERQWTIVNALVQADPFPELAENGRVRIWLKIGAGKVGEQGGENEGLLEKLVEAGVVRE